MIAPAQVIAEARRWVGTPFHHQARARGVGVDCIGLVLGVAAALGIVLPDPAPYGREPLDGLLKEGLDAALEPGVEQPGAIALVRWSREPQHVGILTGEGTLIHAYQPVGGCVEHRYSAPWRRRTVAYYRLPGVAYG